jgi:flagellar basal-body rod modification protein FlgD
MSDGLLFTPVADMVKEEAWNAAATRTPDNSLGKDAFLQLLITQMKYQDPLNPMDDRDFLGQMAQFSALEQMQNLNATFARTQAYSMIGKTVDAMWRNPVTGEFEHVNGFVDAVTTKGSNTFVMVNGKEIPLEAINVVGDDYLTALQLNDILNNVSGTRAQGYVGKYIQAILRNENGVPHEYIEGYVRYVDTSGAQPFLVVNGKEVLLSEVTGVAPSSNDHPFLIDKKLALSGSQDAHIVGVRISEGKALLVMSQGPELPINDLKQLMDALFYVGKPMNHRNMVEGIVQSISMAGGVPVFNIILDNDELVQVDYLDFLDARGK